MYMIASPRKRRERMEYQQRQRQIEELQEQIWALQRDQYERILGSGGTVYLTMLYDRERVIVRTSSGQESLITLRGACRDHIIPRITENARMDRYRYGDLFPAPAHREGGRDYFWPAELEEWYWDHPQLRDRRSRVRPSLVS
jgi:hypothetical protein